MIIKKGYHLDITSWENDGDSYRTERIVVENRDMAKLSLEACKMFSSRNCSSKGLGNSNITYSNKGLEFGRVVFSEAIESNKPLYDLMIKHSIDQDTIYDIVCEAIGSWDDGCSIRVFERAECFYVPEDIEFKNIKI